MRELIELLPSEQKELFLEKEHMKQLNAELKKEAFVLKQKGEVVDKYAAYRLFLTHLVQDNMDEDFAKTAQQFIRQNMPKLHQLHTIEYLNEQTTFCKPNELLQNRILNCMMNAAVEGDVFARQSFVNFFKSHYKKDYNQLKRFHIVTEKDIVTLAGIEQPGYEISINVARLLVISDFMGIPQDSSTEKLYILLNSTTEAAAEEENSDKHWTYFKNSSNTPKDLSNECLLKVKEIIAASKDANGPIPPHVYGLCMEFNNMVLNYNGYPDDYMLNQLMNNKSLEDIYTDTLCLLMQESPREYTYIELQQLAAIYTLTTVYCSNLKLLVSHMDNYLGLHAEECTEEVEVKKFISTPLPTPSSNNILIEDSERDVLRKQIEQLQRELHAKEQEVKNTRALYEEQKTKANKLDSQLSMYQNDRQELASLREHVYRMTEEDNSFQIHKSMEEMIHTLKKENIAIIGGHVNWVNKLKNIFPDFKYIRVKETGTTSDTIMDNVTRAYFFTDTISHCTYNRFVAQAMKKNVPFGYIHSVNINTVINQIYEDLYGKQ